ncbi:MAG: helix-turn-helix domain-containing protein [Kiritimatiellae bacterium]|nr:helix-turn-helix domain-containing protein [Kiritimatiellia bacterium]
MSGKQIDLFVDAEDRRLFSGVRSLQFVISRLPSKTMLSPADIALALDTKVDTVYRWIESGKFEYIDIGSGDTGKPRWRIERVSFLSFLKSRVNKV